VEKQETLSPLRARSEHFIYVYIYIDACVTMAAQWMLILLSAGDKKQQTVISAPHLTLRK
jgi:hypothetical protein